MFVITQHYLDTDHPAEFQEHCLTLFLRACTLNVASDVKTSCNFVIINGYVVILVFFSFFLKEGNLIHSESSWLGIWVLVNKMESECAWNASVVFFFLKIIYNGDVSKNKELALTVSWLRSTSQMPPETLALCGLREQPVKGRENVFWRSFLAVHVYIHWLIDLSAVHLI